MTLPTGLRGQFMAVAILLILLLLSYQLVARPAFKAYQAREEAILETRHAIRRYRHLLAQAAALESFNERYVREQPLAPLLLAGNNPALAGAALQQRLQDLAAQHQVRLLSLRTRPAEEDGGFQRIAVEARMQSNITGLRDLLYDIEQAEPYLFVDSLAIRNRPQRSRRTGQDRRSLLDTRLVVYGLRSPALTAMSEPRR